MNLEVPEATVTALTNPFLQDWHKGKQNNRLAQISNKICFLEVFLFTQIPKLPLI